MHAPLFPPLIAAKMIVTADHIGRGRFGLNIVCGWNENEFDMFGVKPGDHDARYRQGQEWIDVLRRAWTEDDFDYKGEFFNLKGVREKPKPYGGTLPLTMNAGASGDGRAFALRNSRRVVHELRAFPRSRRSDIRKVTGTIQEAKEEARGFGREIDAYTVGVVVCKPTRKEAQEYHRYVAEEHADWSAIDRILAMRGYADAEGQELDRRRKAQANGMGGLPFIGSPDDVANYLATISRAGIRGCGMSMCNYADEFPYFRDEVIPRLAHGPAQTREGLVLLQVDFGGVEGALDEVVLDGGRDVRRHVAGVGLGSEEGSRRCDRCAVDAGKGGRKIGKLGRVRVAPLLRLADHAHRRSVCFLSVAHRVGPSRGTRPEACEQVADDRILPLRAFPR